MLVHILKYRFHSQKITVMYYLQIIKLTQQILIYINVMLTWIYVELENPYHLLTKTY